jgi:hypothetical protein
MDKKFLINVTKTTILNLPSEEEAETIANLLVNREKEDFAGNAIFITTDIKELTNAT